MRQVLFQIPLHSIIPALPDIPVYGYGMMLFLAFILCGSLGARLARREGINPAYLPDLTLWAFVSGIIGARLFFVLEDWRSFSQQPFWRVFALWDGGLIFYGSIFGGLIGYALFYRFVLRKEGVSTWKMADVIAPCIALGSCLGRVGCLLTGCCFGNVACPDCPAIRFPVPNGPNLKMVAEGYQTPLGFLMQPDTGRVEVVEADSAAARAGLRAGDTLVAINGNDVRSIRDELGTHAVTALQGVRYNLTVGWPRGQQDVLLQVRHADDTVEDLGPFRAWGLAVHPTQIYESISMALLLFFLLSYYPFKVRDGSVMVFLMLGYGIHRFLNEMLRTDNDIAAFGMTLSQNISILVLAAGLALAIAVWTRKPQQQPAATPPDPALL